MNKGVGQAWALSHAPLDILLPLQLALPPLPLRARHTAVGDLLLPHLTCGCCFSTGCASAASYGDRAAEITRIAEQRKLGKRIVRGYPILEAEVVYAGRWPPLAWGMHAGR